MALHGFPELFQCDFSIPALGHKGFQDFAFVIAGPPEVVGDTVDLYEDLIQMPPPVGQGAHASDPFPPDLGGKHRAEAKSPEPHRPVADVDAVLLQKVFDVAKRKQEPNLHHHGKTDDLRVCFEVLEWGTFCHQDRGGMPLRRIKRVPLTAPPLTLPVLILERSLKVIREWLCKVA